MSPSMPQRRLSRRARIGSWSRELCVATRSLLILDTAMERLLFDGRAVVHPARPARHGGADHHRGLVREGAAHDRLARRLDRGAREHHAGPGGGLAGERGGAGGHRAGRRRDCPRALLRDVAGLCGGAGAAAGRLVAELAGLPVGVPAGGWSLLLRVSDYGIDGATMSERLLEQGVGATAMAGWGETHGAQYIRFVFANEPVARLNASEEGAEGVRIMSDGVAGARTGDAGRSRRDRRQACRRMNAIDLALVLAVDGSASVTYEEFSLIAGGMASALREPTIIAGLTGGAAKASM